MTSPATTAAGATVPATSAARSAASDVVDRPAVSSGCCPTVTAAPLAEADAAALAHTYAALADPVRLRLLSLIAASGEICSCDLVEPLAKSQPTVSHHTKVLAEAGLITGDKRGRWVHWRVAPASESLVRTLLHRPAS